MIFKFIPSFVYLLQFLCTIFNKILTQKTRQNLNIVINIKLIEILCAMI